MKSGYTPYRGLSGHFGYNDSMKSITDILQRLQQEKTYLQSRFHVAELGVFGSVCRGEAQATSDVDILVDLVAKTAILPHYWQVIEPEVRYV